MEQRTCKNCESAPVAIGTRGRVLRYCSSECRNAFPSKAARQRREQAVAASAKTCGRCEQTLPTSDFHNDRRRVDGLYPYCKECRRAYMGSTPREPSPYPNKAAYMRAYHADLTPEQRIDRARRSHLWNTFRITPEEYSAPLAEQGGGCAICGTVNPGRARGHMVGNFAVDHDHGCCPGRKSCGKCVRGLLCQLCNTGIGALREDPATMQSAMRYLANGGTRHLETALRTTTNNLHLWQRSA